MSTWPTLAIVGIQTFGWIGSTLVVLSLAQKRVMLFRWMNLAGSLIGTIFSIVTGSWPFVAMNAAIVIINAYWIRKLSNTAHDNTTYQVIDVAPDDAYLQHVLRVNGTDISQYAPGFQTAYAQGKASSAFMVVRDNETVGAVILGPAPGEDASTGLLLLDWVTPKYRDFTPGEFVYSDSKAFELLGYSRLIASDPLPSSSEYLRHVGFTFDGKVFAREI
jgi:hypothetical protein